MFGRMNHPWFVCLLCAWVASGCAARRQEANRQLVLANARAYNERNPERLRATLADNLRRHCQATPDVSVRSAGDFLAFAESDWRTFPAGRLEVRQLSAQGNLVGVFGRYTGTQHAALGPFPASGRRVDLDFAGVFRIARSRIAEIWITWDNLAALTQLGHWPPATAPSPNAPGADARQHPAREDFVGAWRLVSWTATVDGQSQFPFGPDVPGLLHYTGDGQMFVFLSQSNQLQPVFRGCHSRHFAVATGRARAYGPGMSSEARPASPPKGGAVEFTTTHWSVVLAAAQEASPGAQEALERLCRTYWPPVCAYLRRLGRQPADAEDLTQQFFGRFLARKHYQLADRERGRFRTFLLTAVKRLLVNEWERAAAQKRGGGAAPVSLDAVQPGAEGRALELPDERTAEHAYEHNWALTLLDQVRTRLEAEYAAEGKAEVFAVLEQFLPGGESACTQSEAARRLQVAEGTLKSQVHRLRRRYRHRLREEVAVTVATPAEIDEELRHLVAVLSRPEG
ncbi:MAG: hypothetical protein FJ387_15900 [Verrucomicrobia bacterium]|nr:hypothetical protein [Verrucomicrobiota bacterium]